MFFRPRLGLRPQTAWCKKHHGIGTCSRKTRNLQTIRHPCKQPYKLTTKRHNTPRLKSNRSTNQSTNQPASQPANQPINQTTSQPTGQPSWIHYCFLLERILLVTTCSKINVRFNKKCSSCSEPIPCTMFGICARLQCFALFCADLRSFCTCCALVSLMTLPKLAPVKE